MTIDEAIKWFEEELSGGKCSPDCVQCNANEIALKALRGKKVVEIVDELIATPVTVQYDALTNADVNNIAEREECSVESIESELYKRGYIPITAYIKEM